MTPPNWIDPIEPLKNTCCQEARSHRKNLGLKNDSASLTKNFLMVQAPGFIRGINPKSKIENPQAPAFIRGVNLKSKIKNQKSIDAPYQLIKV